jgi:hypothetical protein
VKLALAAGLVTAAVLAPAGTAHAEPSCFGTSGTVVVCVDPTGTTYYQDCVYLGGDTCTPVTVPGPSVTCGGMVTCDFEVACTTLLGCLPHPFR